MNIEKIQSKLNREGLHLASLNKRSFAYMIDELIISLLFAIIVWDKLKSITTPEEMMIYSRSLFIYTMSVKVLYHTIFVHMYGATLGKLAMKIKVVDSEDLGFLTLKESFIRAVVRVISEMLFYFGFLVAFFSPIRLTWQDRVAKSLVIDD